MIDIFQIGFYELIALANGGTFESRKNELLDYRMMTNRWIAQFALFRASRKVIAMCAQQGPRTLDPRLHTACPPYVAGVGEVNANEVTISLFFGKSESHSNDDDVSFRPFRDNRPRKYDTGMGGAPAGSWRKFHNTAHSNMRARSTCVRGRNLPPH